MWELKGSLFCFLSTIKANWIHSLKDTGGLLEIRRHLMKVVE